MPGNPLEARMRSLGLKICGDCVHFKDWSCTRFKNVFPAMRSDPACGEHLQKKK